MTFLKEKLLTNVTWILLQRFSHQTVCPSPMCFSHSSVVWARRLQTRATLPPPQLSSYQPVSLVRPSPLRACDLLKPRRHVIALLDTKKSVFSEEEEEREQGKTIWHKQPAISTFCSPWERDHSARGQWFCPQQECESNEVLRLIRRESQEGTPLFINCKHLSFDLSTAVTK